MLPVHTGLYTDSINIHSYSYSWCFVFTESRAAVYRCVFVCHPGCIIIWYWSWCCNKVYDSYLSLMNCIVSNCKKTTCSLFTPPEDDAKCELYFSEGQHAVHVITSPVASTENIWQLRRAEQPRQWLAGREVPVYSNELWLILKCVRDVSLHLLRSPEAAGGEQHLHRWARLPAREKEPRARGRRNSLRMLLFVHLLTNNL